MENEISKTVRENMEKAESMVLLTVEKSGGIDVVVVKLSPNELVDVLSSALEGLIKEAQKEALQ